MLGSLIQSDRRRFHGNITVEGRGDKLAVKIAVGGNGHLADTQSGDGTGFQFPVFQDRGSGRNGGDAGITGSPADLGAFRKRENVLIGPGGRNAQFQNVVYVHGGRRSVQLDGIRGFVHLFRRRLFRSRIILGGGHGRHKGTQEGQRQQQRPDPSESKETHRGILSFTAK